MEKLLQFGTLRQAVDADSRDKGHICVVFLGCNHWFGVCLELLRETGYDEYVNLWSVCRGVWEEEHATVFVTEWCPDCEREDEKETEAEDGGEGYEIVGQEAIPFDLYDGGVIGTVVSISPSRLPGTSHYRLECPKIPGKPVGCNFTAKAGKYKVGDVVPVGEISAMVFSGTYGEDGKVLY